MELCGWTSPADAPPLRRQRPRPPHLRPHHYRHLTQGAISLHADDIPVLREGSGLAGFAAGDPQSDFETDPV